VYIFFYAIESLLGYIRYIVIELLSAY